MTDIQFLLIMLLQNALENTFKLSMYLFNFKPLKLKTERPMGRSNNGCHSFLATSAFKKSIRVGHGIAENRLDFPCFLLVYHSCS